MAACLRLAEEQAARTRVEMEGLGAQIAESVALRKALPSTEPLTSALQRSQQADERLDDARNEHDDAVQLLRSAESARADAVTAADRLAFSHQLPVDRPALRSLEASVGHLTATCDRVAAHLSALFRSHQDWHHRIAAWRAAVSDQSRADADVEQVGGELETRAMGLATLEDSIGTDYAEIRAALQLSAGWDTEDQQPNDALPITVQVTGPSGRLPLAAARTQVRGQLVQQASLLTAKQDQALRNLLQGLVAREVAEKMHTARDLVRLMNQRLDEVTTAHGIGARLVWKRRADIDELASDATIRYHGDFDVPGLAICAQMQRIGLEPWRMDAAHYRSAVDVAASEAVELPVEYRVPGPTPWDPPL